MAKWNPRFRKQALERFWKKPLSGKIWNPQHWGIAKQALNQGVESLSEKQYFVFQKHVLEAHAVNRCIQCEEEIPWHEMIDVHRDGGYCMDLYA